MCLDCIDFVIVMCVLVFFVKQKTAYEMRISDWSSDVCSSDLIKIDILNLVLHPVFRSHDSVRSGSAHAFRREQSGCDRSEEHTSELHSLMRISYAVFCLNKKKNIKLLNTKTTRTKRIIGQLQTTRKQTYQRFIRSTKIKKTQQNM